MASDPVSSAGGNADVRIALSKEADCGQLDWVPVSSRLYPVGLDSSVGIDSNRLERQRSSISPAYARVDWNYVEAGNEFYRDLP